jgi:flagellar biosynthesis chaperone FliJ
MDNLRQIKVIQKAMEAELNLLRAELGKMNDRIQRKQANIKKISEYQQEYAESDRLNMSRETPLLHTNLYSFSKKIMAIVALEEMELNKLISHREITVQKITKVDLKIKIMQHFENRVQKKMQDLQEKAEHRQHDDLATIHFKRDET